MVRVCLVVAVALIAVPRDASAQLPSFTGFLTGHVGATYGGDVGDSSTAAGVGLAVIDEKGLGAEVDIGHTGDFDAARFSDSSLTTFTVAFVGAYPHRLVRPYVTAGGGLVHTRATAVGGSPTASHTEAAWSAGGGAWVIVNEWLSVRGDVRYYRLLDERPGFPESDGVFDCWRISVGASFTWPIR